MGILGNIMGKREPVIEYRTVDGGHPAPYPDMTDEQLYNYEVTFNVARRTFDKPPPGVRPQAAATPAGKRAMGDEPTMPRSVRDGQKQHAEKTFDAPRYTQRPAAAMREPARAKENANEKPPLLDLSKPVRLVTSKQPVEIITTRARHPVYKVHGYIGDDDVVTVFTLDGQLSENGPRFLENVPQAQRLFLNIYPNPGGGAGARYVVTQHESRQEADTVARAGRVACVPVAFDS